MSKTFTNPLYFIAQGFGSGLSPFAPGTVGSAAAIPVWWLLAPESPIAYLALVLLAFLVGVWVCDVVAADMEVKDPGSLVWDEFVGMWLALFLVPPGIGWVIAAFLLFRVFDVWKPWPASWCDRELEGGLGVMLDDVVAGLYSLLVLQGVYWIWAA